MRTLALLMSLSVAVCAQQLQPNTAAATCLINGQGLLGPSNFTQIGSTGTLSVTVQGGASLPYSLFFGSLAPVSIPRRGHPVHRLQPAGALFHRHRWHRL